MIRKRFPRERLLRIVAWTTLALTWVTTIVARSIAAPATDPVEAAPTQPVQATTAAAVAPAQQTVPTMPQDGLVVLRFTPGPEPEPEIQRVVVSTPAPAAQAPTVKRSSGS